MSTVLAHLCESILRTRSNSQRMIRQHEQLKQVDSGEHLIVRLRVLIYSFCIVAAFVEISVYRIFGEI